MSLRTPAPPARRLSRPTVVDAGIGLADRQGLDAVTMRRLAQALGVQPMSLYTHVRGRDDLVDAMVDAVVAGIPVADAREHGWQASVRHAALAARSVMRRHAWAPAALETRAAPGPATRRYVQCLAERLDDAGFPPELARRGLEVLGRRAFGLGGGGPFDDTDEAFALGLDLVLDGLERARIRDSRTPRGGGGEDGDWRVW